LTDRSHISTWLNSWARFPFAATIILTPFRYRVTILTRPAEPVYRDYTDFLVFASDIFLVLTLTLWVAALLLYPRRLTAGPPVLSLPIAVITLLSLVSVSFSVDTPLSLYHVLRLFLLAGLYLYVLDQINSLGALILPVALQIFIQTTVGIGQTLQQRSLGLASLGELALDPAWSGISIVWSEGTRYLRAYGLSDHPNILGGCLAFSLVLLIGWYATAPAKWHVLTSSIVVLGALGLFLTFSRSAWLALSGGLLLVGVMLFKTGQHRGWRNWLNLNLAVLIVMVPFIWQHAGYLGVRLNWQSSFSQVSHESRAVHERLALNSVANQVFAGHALSGVGVGTFPVALRQQNPDFPFDYQPPHVALLEVAAELGIFGALFYFMAMVGPWLALWFDRRHLDFSADLIAVSGLLAAVTIVGLFDYYPWLLPPGRLWQWLAWGLWAAIYLKNHSRQKHA